MSGSPAGAIKTAAARIGVMLTEYEQRVAAGAKWCGNCRDWHDRGAFATDASRGDGLAAQCRMSINTRSRAAYVRKGPPERYGPAPLPARNGDRRQARQRVNVLVRTGRLPRPNDLPCVDCGHIWAPGERRHEYDHYRGYTAAEHLSVQEVCSSCHHRRAEARGETSKVRRGTTDG